MAVGPPSGKVEIEWTAGTWTDVTSYVALEEALSGTFGRTSEFDDVSAGTWTVRLRNDDGRFTPNNPLSPYYPNVVENARLRVTLTPPGGSSYIRFLGYITNIQPTFPGQDGYTGLVQIDAADLMAVMNRRNFYSQWVEECRYIARFFAGWSDVYSFTGAGTSPSTFENLGYKGTQPSLTGTAGVYSAASGAGTWSVDDNPDGALSDAQLTLTPAGIVGPVLQVSPTDSFKRLDFCIKIPTQSQLAVGTTGLAIADFYAGRSELFSIRLIRQTGHTYCDFSWVDSSGAVTTFGGIDNSTDVDTDQWLKISIIYNTSSQLWITVNDSGSLLLLPYDLSTVTQVFFGGVVPGGRAGKQTFCCPMTISGVALQSTTNGISAFYTLGADPGCSVEQRWRELTGYGADVISWRRLTDVGLTSSSAVITSALGNFTTDDVGRGVQVGWGGQARDTTIVSVQSPTQATLSSAVSATVGTGGGYDCVIGPARIGTDSRTVVRLNTIGQSFATAAQTLARTDGGTLWVSNSGTLTLISSDSMRSSTPIATVDIEADCLADDIELQRGLDTVPTRVTVASPAGQAVVVDQVAEAAGYRQEVSIDTCCATYADLYAVGNFYLNSSKALRISKLTIDLAQAQNNLYSALFTGLRPGARIRVSGLPTTVLGYSFVDVFVQGWTETYSHEIATITLDCSPADAPPEAVLDDAEYGRLAAAGTLELALPITSSATQLTIVPSGDVLSGNPGMTIAGSDYPLDIDLNGERVTLATYSGQGVRTNLVTNPSFETGTTGWALGGGSPPSMATSTTVARLGSQSLKLTWPTAARNTGSVNYAATGLTTGTAYTWSVYAYVPAGNPSVFITVSGSPTATTSIVANTGTTVNSWVRLAYAFTASATSHNIAVVNNDAGSSGQVCFLDSAMLEAVNTTLGSYFDGSYGGSWNGTANASTSTQATQFFSGVTRGVAPSVARAHAAGEDVDVWHAAAISF